MSNPIDQTVFEYLVFGLLIDRTISGFICYQDFYLALRLVNLWHVNYLWKEA